MALKTKKKRGTQQVERIDGPRYGWKSVREVERGDSIVVTEQETLVLGVRQHEGSW